MEEQSYRQGILAIISAIYQLKAAEVSVPSAHPNRKDDLKRAYWGLLNSLADLFFNLPEKEKYTGFVHAAMIPDWINVQDTPNFAPAKQLVDFAKNVLSADKEG
jgi:hypothetical protein